MVNVAKFPSFVKRVGESKGGWSAAGTLLLSAFLITRVKEMCLRHPAHSAVVGANVTAAKKCALFGGQAEKFGV